jgi:membrane protein YqaA with SNARE-associated domain
MVKVIQTYLDQLQVKLEQNIDRPWYFFWIAFLAAADMYLSFIPTDIVLFTTIFLRPKRWLVASLSIGLGSVAGAASIGFLVEWKRDFVFTTLFPSLLTHPWWQKATVWVENWGSGAVFVTGLGPFPQQFTLIVAVLGGLSLHLTLFWYTLGRLIKFVAYGWIASHSPKALKYIGTEWIQFKESALFKRTTNIHDKTQTKQ